MRTQKHRKAVVLVLLAIHTVCASEPFARGDAEFGGIRVFYFSGTPRTVGRRHGEVLREEIRYLHRRYQTAFLRLLGGSFIKPFFLKAALKLKIPQHVREEMEGLAEGCGLPYEEILLANTFFDLRKIISCTTVAAPGPEGFLARNLDFPGFDVLHKHTVVFSFPAPGGRRLAAVSFPGLVGVLSGINSEGLAVAVMEVYGKGYRFDAEPYAMAFRRLLGTCTRLEEAFRFLKANPTTTGNNLTACDCHGRAGVFEITPYEVTLRDTPDGRYIYATNHFLSEKPFGPRIQRIRRILKHNPPPTFTLARRLLAATVFAADNLQSIVFFPCRRAFALSAGTLPAAAGQYRHLGAPALGFPAQESRKHALFIGGAHVLKSPLVRLWGFPQANVTCVSGPQRIEAALKDLSPDDLLFIAVGKPCTLADVAAPALRQTLRALKAVSVVVGEAAAGSTSSLPGTILLTSAPSRQGCAVVEELHSILSERTSGGLTRSKTPLTVADILDSLCVKLNQRGLTATFARGKQLAKVTLLSAPR